MGEAAGNCILREEAVRGWPVVSFTVMRCFPHKTNKGWHRVKVLERTVMTHQKTALQLDEAALFWLSAPFQSLSRVFPGYLWVFGRETHLITLHREPILETDENSTFRHSQVGEGIPSWRLNFIETHLWDAMSDFAPANSDWQKDAFYCLNTRPTHCFLFFFIVSLLLPSLSCHRNRAAETDAVALNILTGFQEASSGSWNIRNYVSSVGRKKICSGVMKVYCSRARMWLFSASQRLSLSR